MPTNAEKYENAILYLCKGLGGAVAGKKKLAKLLYYVDFDHFEYKESMKPITGDTYQHWEMGPVPRKYMDVVSQLEQRGKISRRTIQQTAGIKPTEVFIANTDPDVSKFSGDEIYILNRVIRNYGNLSGKQLEILTHQEAPFIATEPNQDIDYELAFYRGTNFDEMAAA